MDDLPVYNFDRYHCQAFMKQDSRGPTEQGRSQGRLRPRLLPLSFRRMSATSALLPLSGPNGLPIYRKLSCYPPNFFLSAAATCSGTRPETSPWFLATSLTIVDDK